MHTYMPTFLTLVTNSLASWFTCMIRGFHKSTGPRMIFDPGGLQRILDIVRVPFNFYSYDGYGHKSYCAR